MANSTTTVPTTTTTTTVSDDMVRLLKPLNLISPVVNNKRRISAAALTSSGIPTTTTTTTPAAEPKIRQRRREDLSISSASASTSANTVASDSFTAAAAAAAATISHNEEEEEANADHIEIPAILESVETYTFVGFDDATAKQIWAVYSDYVENPDPDDTEGEFMDFARWQVENVRFPDATSEDDDWLGYMRAVGVSEELQKTIMLPQFSDIRYTATCQFWLLDTMEMRYGSLRSLDARLRAKATCLGGMPKKSDRFTGFVERFPVSRGGLHFLKRTAGDKPSGMPSPGTGSAPVVADSASRSTNDPIEPAVGDKEGSSDLAVDRMTAPASIAGYTMLWRSGSKDKAETFYNPKTKEISMNAIASFPGDFSGETRLVYWTPQKETANRYASFAKLRSASSELCMIQVAVPDSFTDSISRKYLWSDESRQPTDEWKKLIWYSRKGKTFPKELDHLYQTDLLVGHIASGIHAKFERMSDYTHIRESDLLTVTISGEERRAVQWVFYTAPAKADFVEHCKDKIWLHNLGGALKTLKQDHGKDDSDDDN